MIKIVSVDVKSVKERLEGLLPPRAEMVFDKIKDTLKVMREVGEAPDQLIQESFAREMMKTYTVQSPRRVAIASNVCCHGAGVQCGTYKIYYMDRKPAYSPEDWRRRYGSYPNIYLHDKATGQTITVGTMKGPSHEGLGRAGGYTGWTSDGDGFGFALASFKHNFEALLAGIEQRATAPTTESWTLPNLVLDPEIVQREMRYHAKIVEPPSACPPASYEVSTYLVPRITYLIGIKTDIDSTLILQIRDITTKKEYAHTDIIEVPAGGAVLKMHVRSIPFVRAHILDINPVDAPHGITVSYVKIRRF